MRYKRSRDEDEWVLLDEIPSLNVHELLGRYEDSQWNEKKSKECLNKTVKR